VVVDFDVADFDVVDSHVVDCHAVVCNVVDFDVVDCHVVDCHVVVCNVVVCNVLNFDVVGCQIQANTFSNGQGSHLGMQAFGIIKSVIIKTNNLLSYLCVYSLILKLFTILSNLT
jgi:hypothetical protein